MTLLLMAVTAGGYGWAVQKGYALAGREELAAWGLTCAAVSAWILLFYEVCRSSAAAILTLFAVNVVFLFLAGGIIPSVFLPELVQKVGNMTVTALWMDGIRFIASGGETGRFRCCGNWLRRHWHALHWRLPPEKGGIDGCGSWRGGSVCLE